MPSEYLLDRVEASIDSVTGTTEQGDKQTDRAEQSRDDRSSSSSSSSSPPLRRPPMNPAPGPSRLHSQSPGDPTRMPSRLLLLVVALYGPLYWAHAAAAAATTAGPTRESPHLEPHQPGTWLHPNWTAVLSLHRSQPGLRREHHGSDEDLRFSAYLRRCTSNCSGAGTCDVYSGRCSCELGRKGESCSEYDHFPCNNPNGQWTVSTCFGQCNQGRCFCGAATKNPHRPLRSVYFLEAENMWRRAVAENDTRLIRQWDIDPGMEPRLQWFEGYRGQGLTQKTAMRWCNAHEGGNPRPERMFACVYPEHNGGPLCRRKPLSVCFNQCSGQGRCGRGMCTCDPGWHGIDCSIELPPLPSDASDGDTNSAGRNPSAPPDGASAGAPLPPPPQGTTLQFGGNRARPRIFVYEIPEDFNVRQLAFRREGDCTAREFEGRTPRFSNWQYSLDYMLTEWLLHSDYRTTDPDDADFFFVPFLMSCYTYLGDDHPRHRVADGCRMIATAQASKLILKHIRETYPFWDRSGGRDHLWVWPWDEGSCAAPAAIRKSIHIGHWGGRYTVPRTAYGPDNWLRPDLPWDGLKKGPFGYAFQDEPVTYGMQFERFKSRGMAWTSHEEERGPEDCYDPSKDIVMPPPYYGWMSSPGSLYKRWLSGQLRDPRFNTEMLFYFAGELGVDAAKASGAPGGRVEPHYSGGHRQEMARLFMSEEWRKKGIHVYHGKRGDYLGELSRSTFCGGMTGDGWSNAYCMGILHGCIPVLIMNDTDLAWGNALDWSEFSVHVPTPDIPRLHDILAAIPQSRIRAMQKRLTEIWPRFAYVRYRRDMAERLGKMGYDTHAAMSNTIPLEHNVGDDAFDTLMQTLHYRLRERINNNRHNAHST